MGLPGPTDLSSPESIAQWNKWRMSACQPNFRKNVLPTNGCGPYRPSDSGDAVIESPAYVDVESLQNHDTISMAVIDRAGRIAVGTSTNGATFKIPGRVGDGPIVGSSAYADDEVGACGATGDGDIMMRFLPCRREHEAGRNPEHAASNAMSRIARKYPNFVGAVFAVNNKGAHGGACHGWTFQYSVRAIGMHDVEVFTVKPRDGGLHHPI
ncbi:unnamed protein product [Spirodela intermedia]|uniref:beta-aspartyl-peptidase n=1 Tax=Spirodela intermedia TaxID=51605 RepID=A0A7I8IGQ8_SPIIN|nr:unnamed protein product [Spirodela intermedia]CAA6657073.1 unnamed protein product [Spirodela intermedia]